MSIKALLFAGLGLFVSMGMTSWWIAKDMQQISKAEKQQPAQQSTVSTQPVAIDPTTGQPLPEGSQPAAVSNGTQMPSGAYMDTSSPDPNAYNNTMPAETAASPNPSTSTGTPMPTGSTGTTTTPAPSAGATPAPTKTPKPAPPKPATGTSPSTGSGTTGTETGATETESGSTTTEPASGSTSSTTPTTTESGSAQSNSMS